MKFILAAIIATVSAVKLTTRTTLTHTKVDQPVLPYLFAQMESKQDIFTAEDLMKLFDKDQDGKITWDEFIATLKEEAAEWNIDLTESDIAEAKNMFNSIDSKEGAKADGHVDISELKDFFDEEYM